MQLSTTSHQPDLSTPSSEGVDPLEQLLAGYRFTLAEDRRLVDGALAVRRAAYKAKLGADLPVPDECDGRSWLLAAEEATEGRIVGTLRITPREGGPLECERYFELPMRFRMGLSCELTRFAITPAHRKNGADLPVVKLGLFKLANELLLRIGARWLVIASRPDQIRTYDWLGFERLGARANYGALGGSEHELLWADFPTFTRFEGHPFRPFFRVIRHREIVLPSQIPEAGAWLRHLRPARVAAAGSSES
jgi:hypothetical protein